ncbi:histidine phosphatase family protein [Neokomagataea anthophila]|uniref:Histidine phosphatase family protein n=1 Tax=Neokomagataea anthophila TaxID=2826925 RepID=A0ABS5E7G8_9PROT|nr:histidine phosphatase family protein [Neokomagataea anthophila]MBR0559860.1 histidine phosphatase family protein [Neokomagataea anthophila]
MSDDAQQPPNETHGHFLDEPELPSGVTRFWLIRHAVVEAEARKVMYGALDVELCAETMAKQKAGYRSLAKRLPRAASWVSSPLKRAQDTAAALMAASGHDAGTLNIDERFIEQSIGDWHGTPHGEFPSLLSLPPNPFWSLAATETPPSGESMLDVGARVGRALEERASASEGQDTVIVSHGGAIRAALAHALQVHPETALRFSIQNLSLSIIERIDGLWRVVKVNELPDFGG